MPNPRSTLGELLRERYGSAPELDEQLDTHEGLRTIASHSSHRAFRDEPVDEALVQALFGAAFAAPSKSDLQQASVVRLVSTTQRAEIAALVPQFEWVASAPEFLVWLGDGRRVRRISGLRGRPFANDHLDAFMNAAVDAGIVMTHFLRAAEAVGLGCCPVSVLRNRAADVRRILALPAFVFPVAGMAVGWPGAQPPIRRRLALDATVHVDRYDDADLPAQVDAYDRRRHADHPIRDTARRDPARFGDVELYGWSEDKARQVANPEREDFGAFVRAQGYALD